MTDVIWLNHLVANVDADKNGDYAKLFLILNFDFLLSDQF